MERDILVSVISLNNQELIKKAVLEIENFDKIDLLVIDDGSDYDIFDLLSEYKKVKCISNGESIGYGSCIFSAVNFARDFGYKYLIMLNPGENGFVKNIPNIVSNLDYGYDIINCSRILENSDYEKIDRNIIDFYSELNTYLSGVTEIDLTDPLSGSVGFNVKSIQELDLTSEDHGVMLQVFIQGSYYGLNILEIPSESKSVFGSELFQYDNPLEYLISVIDTEKYLYNKGSIN